MTVSPYIGRSLLTTEVVPVPPEQQDEPTPMKAYPVSVRVGNVKNTDAALF